MAAFEALRAPGSVEQRISFAYAINNIAEGVFNEIVKAGIDPRDCDLIAYGAAGPMLLPAILDAVQVRSVIIPSHAGLFSALGLLSADRAFTESRSRSIYTVLDAEAAPTIHEVFKSLEAGLLERLGSAGEGVKLGRSFDGRLLGQFWETPFVSVPDGTLGEAEIATMIANFHDCAGDAFAGPAIVREELGTLHVHSGQGARVGDYGEIVITRFDRDEG